VRFLMERVVRNERGMTTLFVAALAGVMLLMAVAFLRIGAGSKMGGMEGLRFYAAVDMIKANIYFFGQNNDAWNATLTYNKSAGRMTCIDSGALCTVNALLTSDERVVLVLPGPTVYYDTTVNGRDGFRYNGTVCDYVSTAITGGCTIQADIRWRPFCDSNCLVGDAAARIVFHAYFSTPARTNKDRELWGYSFDSSRVNGFIAF
jgi:hypothetical protein